MICTKELTKLVIHKISLYEKEYDQLSENLDDVGLKAMAKKIKKESWKMSKKFKSVTYKSEHFQRVETYYQLFVTVQLCRIERTLKEIEPILKLLCKVVK
jgi:hypothetical protein